MQQQCVQCVAAVQEGASWQTILALIAALTALASAFIGPMAAYRIALSQTKLTAGVNEHKEWLQEFRNDIASLVTKVGLIRLVQQEAVEGIVDKRRALIEIAETADRLLLRLNPSVPTHLEVMNLLRKVIAYVGDPKAISTPDLRNLVQSLEEASRQLIITETASLRGDKSNLLVKTFRTRA